MSSVVLADRQSVIDSKKSNSVCVFFNSSETTKHETRDDWSPLRNKCQKRVGDFLMTSSRNFFEIKFFCGGKRLQAFTITI